MRRYTCMHGVPPALDSCRHGSAPICGRLQTLNLDDLLLHTADHDKGRLGASGARIVASASHARGFSRGVGGEVYSVLSRREHCMVRPQPHWRPALAQGLNGSKTYHWNQHAAGERISRDVLNTVKV